jgi:hypothetical protein
VTPATAGASLVEPCDLSVTNRLGAAHFLPTLADNNEVGADDALIQEEMS